MSCSSPLGDPLGRRVPNRAEHDVNWSPRRVGPHYPKHGREESGYTSTIDAAMRDGGLDVVIPSEGRTADSEDEQVSRPATHWGNRRVRGQQFVRGRLWWLYILGELRSHLPTPSLFCAV